MNDHRRSIIRHFRKFQLIGWAILALPVMFSFLLPIAFASDVPTLPINTVFLLFMIASGLIALGDGLKLKSYRRRVRVIELVQALASMPVAMLFIYMNFASDAYGGSSFARDLVWFIILMLIVLNLKGVYDHFTMNKEIVTCAEMKDLERRSDEAGLSYLEMMERAGTEAFGYICEEEIDMLKRMLVFCGSGNNGGDGFVVARLAAEYGCQVTVVLPCGLPKTEDAIINYERIKDRIPVIIPREEDVLSDMIDQVLWEDAPNDNDLVIVDGIFGTGFHGTPEGFPRRAIDYINDHRGINSIYSLDVPSGLPGDLGPGGYEEKKEGTLPFYNAVYADCVITFHARKPVHVNRDPYISNHIKRTIVADIGITRALDVSLS